MAIPLGSDFREVRDKHGILPRQRGVATILAVIFLLVVVMLALSQTVSMSSANLMDTNFQRDSTNALLAAESGLERAVGKLNAEVITGTITDTTCTNTIGPAGTSVPLTTGSGPTSSFRFTALTSTPATCTGTACTGCTMTVVGKSGETSRTIRLNVSLTAGASGGAAGCGGGGSTGSAPCNEPNIVQSISTVSVPTILMSNLSFRRHPGGGGNVTATGCVLISGGAPVNCITQWTEESSSGNPAIGGRGASALITTAGTYTLQQNLSANSPYAGSGGRIGQLAGKSLSIIGSYWGETNPQTTSNSSATTGATRNGAAYDPAPGTSPGRPAFTVPAIGTTQSSESWCYWGDTMVMGFSGRSNNSANGNITSWQFGNAPLARGLRVSNAFIQYPTPAVGVNSDVYSDLWYIYNPEYQSAFGGAATSQVNLTGSIGTKGTGSVGTVGTGAIGGTFSGARNGSSPPADSQIVVTGLSVGSRISIGDQISCASAGGCTLGAGTTTIVSQVSGVPVGSVGGNGTYNVSVPLTGPSARAMNAASTILNITAITSGTYFNGAALNNGLGVTLNTSIVSLGTGTGGVGTYNINTRQTLTSTTITVATNILNITSMDSGTFAPGNIVSGSGITGSPTIQAYGTSGTTGTGGGGTYALSSAQNFASTAIRSTSNLLNVTALPGGGSIAAGDVISGTGASGSLSGALTGTIAAFGTSGTTGNGGTGTYQLNLATQQADVGSTISIALLDGTEVRVPVGSALPVLNPSFAMLVTRRTYNRDTTLGTVGTVGSGGQFPAGTTIVALRPSGFKVSQAPTTPLVGGTVCGGTCALFDHSSAVSTTNFSVGVTNTTHWAAGMTCLKGVDPAAINGLVGLGTSAIANSWTSPVNP